MKKPTRAEQVESSIDEFFGATGVGPMVRVDDHAAALVTNSSTEAMLDGLLSAIKFLFLYIPGVAFLHAIVMALGLFALYKAWSFDTVAGFGGAAIIVSFMIMLGIGKLGDLKYLRVVGAVLATSGICSILYAIGASLIQGEWYGTFFFATLPLSLIVGSLVKRHLDNASDAE